MALYVPMAANHVMLMAVLPNEQYYMTYEFVVNDTVADTQIIADGDILTQPAASSAPAQQRFTGWYTDNGSRFTSFGTQTVKVSQNTTVTLTARFEPINYAYFMNSVNGGNVAYTQESAEDTCTVSMYDLSIASNQALMEWTKEKGNPDGAMDSFPGVITEDTYYYPIIREVKWVTFECGGGTLIEPRGEIQGSKINVKNPECTGYTFGGWVHNHGNSVEMPYYVNEDVTLIVQWTANTDTSYTVANLLENADDDVYSVDESLAPNPDAERHHRHPHRSGRV